MKYRISFFLLFIVAAILAACAGPRPETFDVPAAAPVPNAGVRVPVGRASPGLRQAEAEISATRLYFSFDRWDLRPESVQALSRMAGLMREHPDLFVRINGHCDERGSSEYNYALGERRARAAYGKLLEFGASPLQMEMYTYGEEVPADPGRTEDAYARNRRDEFLVFSACR